MRRRRLLAALATLPASLAGCLDRAATTTQRPTKTSTRSTPKTTATPLTETEPLPDPPDSPDGADALSFVREYERVAARNEVVEYGDGAPARNPEIGDPAAALVVVADAGFYIFGACSADAHYGEHGGYGINRHEVPHFVGRDGTHEVGGWSAVVCGATGEAYAAADAEENAVVPGEGPGAEIHLFRFDGGERAVSVAVDYLDAGAPRRVFSRTVELSPDGPDPAYEYVLSNVAVRTGEYRVAVDVPESDRQTTAKWTLTHPEAVSWNGLSVFVGDGGRPHVGLPEAGTDDSLVPGPSRCFRHRIEHEE
ncbi:hypothetical protein [Halobellus ordinarius]|uniref:hypothetical protein n=1 Tax=Halobellus ordinarius TaxID=3075120 RepID=UPI0028807C7C|nr:hypothetical protein [Halobellus sp. ZY16]